MYIHDAVMTAQLRFTGARKKQRQRDAEMYCSIFIERKINVVHVLDYNFPENLRSSWGNVFRCVQSTTQYKGDDTVVTTATGDSLTAEEFADGFFGGEYKYSNR